MERQLRQRWHLASDAANGVYLAGTDTVGITTGGTQRVTVDGSGNVAISGDLTVEGQTTTVESTIVTIDDKNLELGSVASPNNTTADGGGITLKVRQITLLSGSTAPATGLSTPALRLAVICIRFSKELALQDLKSFTMAQIQPFKMQQAICLPVQIKQTLDYIQPVNNEDGIAVMATRVTKLFGTMVLRKLETKSDGVDVTGEVQCDFVGR